MNSQTFLGHNRAVYQDLRAALQLSLRRQLLIAICDDSGLQRQLAQQLEAELSPGFVPGLRQPQEPSQPSPLVTLRLDSRHPDLVREVLLWLKQQRRLGEPSGGIPAFQIVGVETLTQQSPTIQNRFLASLIRVDTLLTRLDCRLLVWVPRPWLGKIQQVVPGFWQLRNGLYEFEGEPTADVVDFPPVQTGPSPTAGEGWSAAVLAPAAPEMDAWAAMAMPMVPPAAETGLVLPLALAGQEMIRQRWQHLHRLHQQQAGPLTLAQAYLALGYLCREAIVPGDEGLPILMFTLEVYQRALQGLVVGDRAWCDALNDMASLYWMRAQLETQPEAMESWLQRSVAAYQRAIEGAIEGAVEGAIEGTIQGSTAAALGNSAMEDSLEEPAGTDGAVTVYARVSPDTLGRLYSNLGRVYTQLADLSDPKASLAQAAAAYTQALRYTVTAPLEYANGQNSLGAIHWRLSQMERPQYHLHRAITAYQAALRYRLPQAEPQDYAMLQNNLGIAYWSLAQYEPPIPWLEQAVDAYQTALVYRTLATHPAGYAVTSNNLGTAYWDLAQQQAHQPQERLSSLRQAADAYEAALDAVEYLLQQSSPEAPDFDPWATCHSAGIVHDQIALALPVHRPEERERHLKAALNHYLLAYAGWQNHPDQLDVLAEALVYSVRLHFDILGFSGQQAVLSQLPPELLGRVLPQL
ncbi:MAG: hypothetical protein VKI82_07555 [Leptolyngbya sp.]|nr:hypothetical protein [Leptolyngbya sp.]